MEGISDYISILAPTGFSEAAKILNKFHYKYLLVGRIEGVGGIT